jgi:putative zinc finger protein
MMGTAMDCQRAEELLSDDLEGALPGPLELELHSHLVECAGCRELRSALEEVLAVFAARAEIDPPAELAERAAAAALARRRPRVSFGWTLPRGVNTLAAALAIASTAAVLLVYASASGRLRAPGRVYSQTVNVGVQLIERTDRVIEDFRILRVVISTALEGRIDRVNDRVDDYRRLLERRRTQERREQGTSLPSNLDVAGLVPASVNRAKEVECRRVS